MGNNSKDKDTDVGPVVLASHLAAGAFPELSQLEYVLTVTTNAFQRWTVRCMNATGQKGLVSLDVLILHNVHHKGREKTLADLCLSLNVEDTHLVNYSLKKLESLKLVKTGKRGKEKTVTITPKGAETCESYHRIREKLLVESILELGADPFEIAKAARLLRAMSGQYDQAARSAVSL